MIQPTNGIVSDLRELCEVCERVRFGDVQRLGFGKWRHAGCYPGSVDWLDYIRRMPEAKRTNEQRYILAVQDSKEVEPLPLGDNGPEPTCYSSES